MTKVVCYLAAERQSEKVKEFSDGENQGTAG